MNVLGPDWLCFLVCKAFFVDFSVLDRPLLLLSSHSELLEMMIQMFGLKPADVRA